MLLPPQPSCVPGKRRLVTTQTYWQSGDRGYTGSCVSTNDLHRDSVVTGSHQCWHVSLIRSIPPLGMFPVNAQGWTWNTGTALPGTDRRWHPRSGWDSAFFLLHGAIGPVRAARSYFLSGKRGLLQSHRFEGVAICLLKGPLARFVAPRRYLPN